MYNLSDEEFDRLCREAADKPESRNPADGWEKLRERLDLEMPQEKGRRRGWILWIPFMIILPLALWFRAESPGSSQVIGTAPAVKPAGLPAAPAPEQAIPASSPAAKRKDMQAAKGFAENRETGSDASTRHSNGPMPKKQVAVNVRQGPARTGLAEKSDYAEGARETDLMPRRQDNRPRETDIMTRPQETKPGEAANKPDVQAVTTLRQDIKPGAKTVTPLSQGITPVDSTQSPAVANIPGTDTVLPKPLAPANNTPTAKQSFKKGLAVSGVIGPDFSNVDFAAPDKTGMNMGIILEYQFSRRWSIQAGFLYSRKHYTAIGDAYKGYPGYNPSNPALEMDHVQANCFMWDFPLNIRYDFLEGRKHLAYATVGTSSYLMNREDLHYYYTYYNTPRYKQWENTSQSMYWFAAANLSLGYAYRFTPVLSARLEPFLKMPLRSVGYGSVDLNSLGLLMGITYRLPGHHVKPTKK